MRVFLPNAFINRHDLQYKSSNCVLSCCVDIGELIKHERLYPSNPEASIHSSIELSNCSDTIDSIIVDNNACNDTDFVMLDLTHFACLREFKAGCYSFSYVKEVKLIGLNQLESVLIGKNSFTKHKNGCSYSPNRHFYLRNCERLKELKIGCYSFSDYSVCEIDTLPSLEVIEMGELNEESNNFWYASLELKGECCDKRMMNRHAPFEIASVWL